MTKLYKEVKDLTTEQAINKLNHVSKVDLMREYKELADMAKPEVLPAKTATQIIESVEKSTAPKKDKPKPKPKKPSGK